MSVQQDGFKHAGRAELPANISQSKKFDSIAKPITDRAAEQAAQHPVGMIRLSVRHVAGSHVPLLLGRFDGARTGGTNQSDCRFRLLSKLDQQSRGQQASPAETATAVDQHASTAP
ncbi:hypothetical protein BH11PSE2_BH11PSE2_14910 [soil metagenome]